jgi:hypothetical protein
MNPLEIVIINNKQYYKADDVHERNSAYFYGCANNPRNIVDKKNISQENYLYAYLKNDQWVLSKRNYCRAKLLLTKTWVDDNIKGIDETKEIKNDVEMGPPIITLDDDEYFTDCDNNKLEIKIRGDRRGNSILVLKILLKHLSYLTCMVLLLITEMMDTKKIFTINIFIWVKIIVEVNICI